MKYIFSILFCVVLLPNTTKAVELPIDCDAYARGYADGIALYHYHTYGTTIPPLVYQAHIHNAKQRCEQEQ